MLVSIKLYHPNCQSTKIVKKDSKKDKKQNYLCNTCKHQFISNHNQKGTHKIGKKHTTDIEENNTFLKH